MQLKKSGISIDCAHCECINNADNGGFDVQVPLSDDDSGIAGTARLHCEISPQHHQVEIIDWQDADSKPIDASAVLKQRLDIMLEFIEEHRVCGNSKVCPDEVIHSVQAIERPEK